MAVAQQAFGQWGEFFGRERGDIMERAAQILQRRLPEFVAMEVEQIGRPCREMAAQLARAPEWFSYFGSLARTHEDTVPPFGRSHLH